MYIKDNMASNTTPRNEASARDKQNKPPYVLVKSDRSVSVVNPLTGQAKKSAGTSYALDRNISADSAWICVFCKRGSNTNRLGDLFGPYFVTTECEEYVSLSNAFKSTDALFVNNRKRCDMVQVHPRNLPVVPAKIHSAADSVEVPVSEMEFVDCGEKLVLPCEFSGMKKVAEKRYEVWVHEDCSVWAPGVLLVGSQIIGLDAAVWSSYSYICVLCSKPGANICCLQRNCKAPAHVPCAMEAHWKLNEVTFQVHCEKHAEQTNVQKNYPAKSSA